MVNAGRISGADRVDDPAIEPDLSLRPRQHVDLTHLDAWTWRSYFF
jgi:hypothetical protein